MKRMLLLLSGCVLVPGAWWYFSKPVETMPKVSQEEETGEVWLEDVTEAWGLDFVHDAGPIDGKFFMPQAIGSGVALLDIDNDGRLDLYLLNNGGPQGRPNQLYRQRPNHTFENISSHSGLDIAGYNMGVAVADINKDGYVDLLITQYCGVKLFRNNGNSTFTEITQAAKLENPAWGTSASFVDYDRDGWLDLVIANYVEYDPTWPCTKPTGQREYCAPNTFPGKVTRLFRNLGNSTFEDVTVSSGLGKLTGPGLGVVCLDFDGDSWPDIFVANDGKPNRLWINQKNGTFVEEGVRRSLAYNAMGQAEAGMGIGVGDVDNDGLFDIYITHLTEETNTLWRQGPKGLFRDSTLQLGVAKTRWRGTGFGTAMIDFNHDGWLDLAVVNGRISMGSTNNNEALGNHWGFYAECNQILQNEGLGKFRDRSENNKPFCSTPNVARGLAYGDMDNDGALDVVITTIGNRARIFRNVAPNRGHWLIVRAIDSSTKQDAIGAEITVHVHGQKWVRHVLPASSYLCSNDARVHFGLGNADHVDQIDIRWPNGEMKTYPGTTADQIVTLP